jgi:hypothetical protein
MKKLVWLFLLLVTPALTLRAQDIAAGKARHSQSIAFPSGTVCNVITQYGAVGNGETDDTTAVQNALNNCQTVYLPDATYRITGPLLWPAGYGSVWMVGQSQTGTILQLDNNKFTDDSTPTTILDVCTNGGCPSDSNYFDVGIRDLTLNTGNGNKGVVGIDFYASNIGAVRDVTVTSGDGSGVAGFSLDATSANGPLLVKNLTVNGFKTGVEASIGQVDSATLEHIYVNHQTVTGVNINGTVSMRGLRSHNRVPGLTQTGGFLTLIDSSFNGGAGENPAIVVTGGDVLVRNIRSSGYGHALVSGSTKLSSPIREWTNDHVYHPFGGTGRTLDLRIEETPTVPWDDPSTWAIVYPSGGDDTDTIQNALNSGASTVCLCGTGGYTITRILSVGGNVSHVIGIVGAFTNELPGDGLYPLPPGVFNGPIFRMAQNGPPTVVFEQIEEISGSNTPMWDNPSSRTMVVLDSNGNASASGPGKNFIDDLSGNLALANGSAWSRQLNPEVGPNGTAALPLVTNRNGSLWILGQKQEGGAVTIQAHGGQTELLGGLMYDCCGVGTSEFVVKNGRFSARIDEANYGGGPNWTYFVKDTEDGKTKYVLDNNGLTPGVLGLYTNAQTCDEHDQ